MEIIKMKRRIRNLIGLLVILILPRIVSANMPAAEELKIIEPANNQSDIAIQIEDAKIGIQSAQEKINKFDPLRYTLGPEDVVEITVMRHPEFSGVYSINQEGKLQYKFVGDIDVNGLTKKELEEKVKDIISNFVIAPEVNVTVMEYKSKVIYVLGEITTPGKYYMRSETIPVREAVFQAGLPTLSAAMRKCQIISPTKKGRAKVKKVDLYSILYKGNLAKNINMYPGDILYIPSTVMAKVIRVINPVASTVGVAAAGPSNASGGKTAIETLAK